MTIIKLSKHINGRTRYNLFGKLKGFVAVRKRKSRGFGIQKQNTFTQLHLGRVSIAVERRSRHTGNFAG
jgi:hypothetical protein